jgi:hypothetical protein
MLRQDPQATSGNPLTETAGFGMALFIAPEAAVLAGRASGVLSYPNPLSDADWRGWIISRARSPLVLARESDPLIHLKDGSTGAPLIASVKMGEGTVTAVALDMSPQLQIVHPGAYRLIANLVSY